MNIISERIKMARKHRKMKAKELSALSGVSPSAICQFERGRNAPKRKTLFAICKALNVSSDFIFGLVPTDDAIQKILSENPRMDTGMAVDILCRLEIKE